MGLIFAQMSDKNQGQDPDRTRPEADAGNPQVILLLLAALAMMAIIGGLFLNADDSDPASDPDAPELNLPEPPPSSGQVKDGRYQGKLIAFRLPEGATKVSGTSDGYSENVSWKTGPNGGELSAVKLLPGETLADIAEISGIKEASTEIAGQKALLIESRAEGVFLVQAYALNGGLKVTVSALASSRAAAIADVRRVLSSLKRSRA